METNETSLIGIDYLTSRSATLVIPSCLLLNCMKELDEKELVLSVLKNNRAAFETLIRRYERLVLHIVCPLIKNEHDREDICQDVFMKVYEHLHAFQFRSKLSSWIGQIAYNAAVNFLKKKKSILFDDVTESQTDAERSPSFFNLKDPDNPAKILLQKEEQLIFESAVNKLPAIQKTILLLFHQDELSLIEISEIHSLPVNTVKSHLFRARTNLKEILLEHKYSVS